ncbi:FAD-dependent oxidoreductase [Micromonospora sp. NPDC049523]|uniref:FAD-dependent oxidoreductase n=1 Tax=Micromonospora sp. NPDC049523 TaxID=3155921 RepID=UPI00343B68B1
MTISSTTLPVAVIGAGPVGLAAAAHLAERRLDFVVLEAGTQPGSSISQWGHVRVFSPWRYNIDTAARRLLDPTGWAAPEPHLLPTGADLVTDYLQPLAKLSAIAPQLRYHARVVAIGRLGVDRVRSRGRQDAPFVIRLANGDEVLARAVIDASGTWTRPNALGASGLPAYGEGDIGYAVEQALPDVLGADRTRFAGSRVLVVGAGHSAANTLLSLADLATQEPGATVYWAIRAATASRAYGGGDNDALPARGALGTRLHAHVEAGRITLLTGFSVHTVRAAVGGGAVEVVSLDVNGGRRSVTVDRIVSATGFRPDHTISTELRLDLDPIMESPRALAPLIDPNQHSCGTVPPHGADHLAHPEPGFYTVGMKSYGRAPTFLMATGYEQVRSVVAALAGDWEAARDVQLELPETGVCSSDLALGEGEGEAGSQGGCCGPAPAVRADGRGLATGMAGGLLAVPLPLVAIGTQSDPDTGTTGGGCCG